MSRSARAALRQNGDAAGGFSLYPFLAVLICTMGTLIVLLVIIARQAQIQAVEEQSAETAAEQQAVEEERQSLLTRIEELESARERANAAVAEWRLALGRAEDHAHALAKQLARLEQRQQALKAGTDGGRRQLLETELARVQSDIAEARDLLAEERQRVGGQRPSYAVVPYEGPNGTRRRPIYIECRSDSVVLQPEGVTFGEADFDGPLGAGNPLDAAIRSTREYLLERGQFAAGKDEPYPLFLVRPSGIGAYYVARMAIVSWASDFGYELIDDDWEMAFPLPDPNLAASVEQVVATARARQTRLATAAPSHFRDGSGGGGKYRVGPNGGLVRIDEQRGSGGYRPARPSGRFARELDGERRDAASQETTGAKPAVPHEGYVGSRPHDDPDDPVTPHDGAATPVLPRPGDWMPKPTARNESTKPEKDSDSPSTAAARCLADERGRNWGLPGETRDSVPVTRPIRVDCYEDRLVLVREDGSAGTEIRLGPQMENAIDEFVAAVWDEMDAWGIAGKGMYWRPILNVRVAPNADQRYQELETLLRDSGLEVRRAGTSSSGEQQRVPIPSAARPSRLG